MKPHIRNLLTAEKYEEIDRIAAAARVSKARLRGGYWELHILYGALNSPSMALILVTVTMRRYYTLETMDGSAS